MIKIIKSLIVMLICSVLLLPNTDAVETAPRITDREIIESLAELKQGQVNLNRRMDDFNRRFEYIDNRFESIDNRFESIDNRFESIENRFDSLQNLIVALFGSVMALIIALIGYMIWDRKTAQQPLKERISRLEKDHETIDTHLDMQNPSGPVMERVLAAFRKLAETDEKVAAILRSYSLL